VVDPAVAKPIDETMSRDLQRVDTMT